MFKAMLTGRLGRDAETKTTSGGTVVTSFSIAHDKRKGGEKTTIWVDCALFGDRGSKLAQYLTKGAIVDVTGDIELQEFTKRDGGHASKLSIRVDDIGLHGGNKRDDDRQSYDRAPPQQQKPSSWPASAGFDDLDSIPF